MKILRIVGLFLTVKFIDALEFKLEDFTDGRPLQPRSVINDVLEYFKARDPHGIPVLQVPEPFYIDETFTYDDFGVGNLSISGQSQIRLDHVLISLEDLQAKVKLEVRKLMILADYTWGGFWFSSEGDLNATFINFGAGLTAFFNVNQEGILQVKDLEPVFSNDNFLLDMTGLSGAHEVLVYTGSSLFDTIVVPFLQMTARTEGLETLNPELRSKLADFQLPVDMLPIDYYVAKLAASIAEDHNLDPFKIPKKELELPLPVSFVLTNLTLTGISSIHRAGVLQTEFLDNKIYFRVELGTQTLNLKTDYSVATSLVSLSSGSVEFSIEGLKVLVDMFQPADVTHPPTLRKIDLELGNFALLTKGDENINYFMEALINVVPNILKNEYLDKKLEEVMEERIQNTFNTMDVEKLIQEALDNHFPE